MLSENINGSLSLIDKQVYIDVDPSDIGKAVDMIDEFLADEIAIGTKSNLALRFSHETLLNWQQRTKKEIDLLAL